MYTPVLPVVIYYSLADSPMPLRTYGHALLVNQFAVAWDSGRFTVALSVNEESRHSKCSDFTANQRKSSTGNMPLMKQCRSMSARVEH